jgi:hypothetical protein
MSLTSFMRHIRVLEQCGLVRTSKLGRIRDCVLEPEPLRLAERWLRLSLWARYSRSLGSLPEDWGLAPAERGNRPQPAAAGVCPESSCSTSASSESIGAEQLLPRQR